MKGGALYTVGFIIVLSLVFGLVLGGASVYYGPRIEANELLAERRAILYIFDLETTGSAEEINDRFETNITRQTVSGVDLYAYIDDENTALGYAVPFSGAALWGSMHGYLGISPDLERIIGVVFTEHSETPGLGGRIDELVYREQFRDLPLDFTGGLTYDDDGLDAITGATSTSNAVLRVLNQLIDQTISQMEVQTDG